MSALKNSNTSRYLILEGKETSTDAEFQLHEKIFEEIHDTLNERGIKIDELIT